MWINVIGKEFQNSVLLQKLNFGDCLNTLIIIYFQVERGKSYGESSRKS